MAVRIESGYPINGYIETLIGGRTENQDSAGFKDVELGCLVVVCDGMGGGNGGSTASRLAVQTVIDDMSLAKDYHDPIEKLTDAIKHANEVVYTTGNADPSLKGMGTTLTALLLSEHSAIIAHLGDSRVYQFRGHDKVFRTNDHSMVFQLVKQGFISEEEARNHPQSNVILAAIGIGDTVEPEITEVSYNKGDRFVLCTDGFWGMMPEKEFIHYASGSGDLEETIVNTANEVNSLGIRHGGGHDNLTAAMIDIKRNSKLSPKMRTSHIAILCSLIGLLLLSIAMNVLVCIQYSKQTDSAITELFFSKSNKSVVDEGADSADVFETEVSDDEVAPEEGQEQ